MKKKIWLVIICLMLFIPTTKVVSKTTETNQTETGQAENLAETENVTIEGQIKAITCTGNEKDQIPANVPKFIRALYNVLKVMIPLFIIFLGMFDFIRAVVSSNDTDMDNQKNKFVRRLIAGVTIFFVLAFVQWIFGLIGEQENILGCVSCFLSDEKDCHEAGYIDPGKNDENSNPNKTPPNSNNDVGFKKKTNTSSSKSSSNSNKGSKTILLGDSRTAGICGVGDSYYSGKCRDYLAVCQSGKGYTWFEQTGAGGVTSLLNKDKNTKYNIVILLGVNDISGDNQYIDTVANIYMKIIKNQAKGDWKSHNVIFASVTPIGGSSTNDRWPVTESGIKEFNSKMKSNIKSAKLSNVSYCDISSGINLSGKFASDLLHYTSAGYTAMYNQIKNKCL